MADLPFHGMGIGYPVFEGNFLPEIPAVELYTQDRLIDSL
jgi:hypothetical protein